MPDRPDLKWGLADLLIQSGKLDEAGEMIARLRGKDNMRTETLDYLEGRIRADQRQWAEAIRLLEKSRALMAGTPGLEPLTAQADLLLAECYERLDNPEQQLAASRGPSPSPRHGPRPSSSRPRPCWPRAEPTRRSRLIGWSSPRPPPRR